MAWLLRCLLLASFSVGLVGCITMPVAGSGVGGGILSAQADALILVTVDNPHRSLIGEPGSSPHGYDFSRPYAISDAARGVAGSLERDYRLRPLREWPIAPLRVDCLVFALPAGANREQVLRRMSRDPRVRVAEPLQMFASRADLPPTYNDPYYGLQSGFNAIGAEAAQRWSNGSARIAIIDTGVDLDHPDLAGQIAVSANFVDQDRNAFRSDRHGTAVAGLIGAVANNNVGIVGIAPGARLQVYKACQPLRPQSLEAVCNSFTLARALSAAIDAHAQLVNLSLGGPADPLLTQLVQEGERRGMVFVGAVSEDGGRNGFPVGINGVIAVDAVGRPPVDGVLYAPGRDIVTLAPAGHYDFGSGSSFAAAHVTGAIALLLGRDPRLDSQRLWSALAASEGSKQTGTGINVCAALAALHAMDDCPNMTRSLAINGAGR